MTYPCSDPTCPYCQRMLRPTRRKTLREAISQTYPRLQVMFLACWSLLCLIVFLVWLKFKPESFIGYTATTTTIILARIGWRYRKLRRAAW